MNKKIFFNTIIIVSFFLITNCSKTNTKEFFFGSSQGPDPFVIGATLPPLKMSFDTKSELPKPKPVLSLAQMPSHAKKATEILDVVTETKAIDTNLTNTQTKIVMSDITNSIQANNKIIDFQKFDNQMNAHYAQQENNGYLLPKLLGSKKTIDPTIREKLNKE